ncbi:sugar ABC transporter permease [Marispirochaeta aestuarii]|uniref:carbohydrate ABC transporter permease n=1 Tax=Marispirochaeta aestuarii TaxID=1963862 RepID=UPI0029C68AB4|nr:sugar ABC transporter permease [Marispirochaeta aestuarii]
MNTVSLKVKGGRSRYLFLMPAMLILFSVIIIPAVYSLYISLFSWNGVSPHKKFVGLQNYFVLFTQDPTFQKALINNLLWTLMTLFITVSVALMFALLINKRFKGNTVVRGIIYLPYVFSGIVVSIIWTWVYQPQLGLLNSLYNLLGLGDFPVTLLANEDTAFYAVYAASLWQTVGAPMIIFLAGLQTIPIELYEAAHIDGAGKWHVFRLITIPMLSETFVIVVATQIVRALKVYDIIRGMTGGGPGISTQTLASYMVQQTFTFTNYGIGSAIAWIMVVMMMVVVIPYVLYMSKD